MLTSDPFSSVFQTRAVLGPCVRRGDEGHADLVRGEVAKLDRHVGERLDGLQVEPLTHLGIRIGNAEDLGGEVADRHRVRGAKGGPECRQVKPSHGSVRFQQRVVEVETVDVDRDALHADHCSAGLSPKRKPDGRNRRVCIGSVAAWGSQCQVRNGSPVGGQHGPSRGWPRGGGGRTRRCRARAPVGYYVRRLSGLSVTGDNSH